MAGIYFISGSFPSNTNSSAGELGAYNYVGMTKRDLGVRLNEHLRNLKKGSHSNQFIQEHYDLYGRGHVITGAVIECREYYLNTMEKQYIEKTNSYTGQHPLGWNKSKGGEGAQNYSLPFSFHHAGENHFGTNLNQFLNENPELDPSGVMSLREGSIDELNGWTKLK